MGQNGRDRVASSFDWKMIIPQYDQLWSELNSRRTAKLKQRGKSIVQPYPSRPDPFELFEHYPTQILDSSSIIALALDQNHAVDAAQRALNLKMFVFYKSFITDESLLVDVVASIGKHQIKLSELTALISSEKHPMLICLIGFLLKINVIELVSGTGVRM